MKSQFKSQPQEITVGKQISPVKSLLKNEKNKKKRLQIRGSTGVLFGPSLSAVLKSFLIRSPMRNTHKHCLLSLKELMEPRTVAFILFDVQLRAPLRHTRTARAHLNTAPGPSDHKHKPVSSCEEHNASEHALFYLI